MGINYVVGDATQPIGEGPKIIVHVCNDVGAWGCGFVLALSERWPVTEQRYRAWHSGEAGNVTPSNGCWKQYCTFSTSMKIGEIAGNCETTG